MFFGLNDSGRCFQSLMPFAKQNQKIVVKTMGLFQTRKGNSLRLMHKAFPNLKILIIVRNPITRIVSHFVHEFYNSGGMFYGEEVPDTDDILMQRSEDTLMTGDKSIIKKENVKVFSIYRFLQQSSSSIIQLLENLSTLYKSIPEGSGFCC